MVEVDPQLSFQRLTVFIKLKEISDAFSYELCTRPSSLFGKKDLMKEAHKLELKNALYSQLGLSVCIMPDILQNTHYFLNGAEGGIVAKTSMDCWKHV